MLQRYISSIGAAAVVTFGLFYIMQILVSNTGTGIDESVSGKIVDMVRVKRDETIQRRERKVEKPPEIEEMPPDIDIPQANPNRPVNSGVAFSAANVDADVSIGSGGMGQMDGEYLPIVKVAPVYPRRAAERGVSGSVLLEFTVTELGTVENPVVIEADPPGYFERAAIRAALKFKYKPKVVNGEPVRVDGVRNLITFELEDEK